MGRKRYFSRKWRGPVLVAIVVGAVSLAALAIYAARGGVQIARTNGDNSAASNLDETKAKTGGGQYDSTTGAKSPASNVRQ